jgi:hypothetical protein
MMNQIDVHFVSACVLSVASVGAGALFTFVEVMQQVSC